ncbi:MAG: aldehyde dehydrogenase family protein [Nitrospiraceae bacterium]
MDAVHPLLIGGQWQRTAMTLPVTNPFTGEKVAEVCQAGLDEADAAVKAAVNAAALMRDLPAHARAGLLQKVAATLHEQQDELARVMTSESGKPITDARREVARAVQTFTVAGEEAKRIPGDIVPMDWTPGNESYLGLVRRFPIGPILGVTPFNFPLNLVAHKVAPALAAGNPIVIKSAPQTPLTALFLGEVVMAAGLAAGGLSVLSCDNQVAEYLVADPRFKLLSFTGSAAVGWMLKAKCGKKRVVLELGGNAGVIVEPDADLDYAAHRCAIGGYTYAGQSCISVQQIFVHQSVLDLFTTKLLMQVARLKAGDPGDDKTIIGPLIDQAAAARIEDWVGEAVAQGGRILLGGKRTGAIMGATVLTDVTPTMKVSCQELFGPVVTITPYRQFEEALNAVNRSAFGLQTGVFTNDVNRLFQAFRELEVGAVLANEVPTFRADHMPYGGVKDSGLGREGIRYAIEDMTEPRLLVMNLRQPAG